MQGALTSRRQVINTVVEVASLPRQRCGYHPPVARREAPHNQRIQQTIPPANKFASGLAPDPQRYVLKEKGTFYGLKS